MVKTQIIKSQIIKSQIIKSMTGFAAGSGEMDGYSWDWELRSVNAKGLDIRMRLPDWIEGLEKPVREMLAKSAGRGSVNLTLRVTREQSSSELNISQSQLARVIAAISKVENVAADAGLILNKTSASEVLNQRGVIDTSVAQADTAPLKAALLADLPSLLQGFVAMRQSEGEALDRVIKKQLEQIKNLTTDAVKIAQDRKEYTANTLRQNLARVLDNTDGVDAGRLEQELALIAVKADIAEELDRLSAHVDAANDLLAMDGPVGRKLDFLMQEFMREANTLCSKSGFTELTRVGLDLKATIDQMREQVQNVE